MLLSPNLHKMSAEFLGLETSPTDYNGVAIDKGGARPADGTSALRVRKRTRQRGCQTWRKSNVCFCQEQSEGERARERERERERERKRERERPADGTQVEGLLFARAKRERERTAG